MGAFIFFVRAIKTIGICYPIQPLFRGRESIHFPWRGNRFSPRPLLLGTTLSGFPQNPFPLCGVRQHPRLHHSGVCPRRFTPGLPPSFGRCGRRPK